MMYVFHLVSNASDDMFRASIECRDPRNALRYYLNLNPAGRYQLVAEVDTDKLSAVFERTNHIESSWDTCPHPTVTVHKRLTGRGHRSTSVGDVVLDAKRGTLHFCAPFGWDLLLQNQPDPATLGAEL